MAQNPNIGREILPTLSEGTTPNKPFCTYMSCGAIHAPPEWIEKYRGKCNKGWDAVRAEVQAGRKTTGSCSSTAPSSPRSGSTRLCRSSSLPTKPTLVEVKPGAIDRLAKLFDTTNPALVATHDDWEAAYFTANRDTNVVTVSAHWRQAATYEELRSSVEFQSIMAKFAESVVGSHASP